MVISTRLAPTRNSQRYATTFFPGSTANDLKIVVGLMAVMLVAVALDEVGSMGRVSAATTTRRDTAATNTDRLVVDNVGFDWPSFVGTPLAPRPDVQICFDAEHGQRQQIVTGRNP